MGDFEDAVDHAIDKQQKQRARAAYKKGKARHDEDRKNPANSGSPGKDGYGSMTPEEKAAYKKGFRGE